MLHLLSIVCSYFLISNLFFFQLFNIAPSLSTIVANLSIIFYPSAITSWNSSRAAPAPAPTILGAFLGLSHSGLAAIRLGPCESFEIFRLRLLRSLWLCVCLCECGLKVEPIDCRLSCASYPNPCCSAPAPASALLLLL